MSTRQPAHKHSDTPRDNISPTSRPPTSRPTMPPAAGGKMEGEDGLAALCRSPIMARLLDALEQGTDIGHHGRLTFVMVARFFLSDEDLVRLLAQQPDQDEESAHTLVVQVQAHDYNPPTRERIVQWQAEQDFQLCPDADDPTACNVYRELRFPDRIYDHISDYWEEHMEDPTPSAPDSSA